MNKFFVKNSDKKIGGRFSYLYFLFFLLSIVSGKLFAQAPCNPPLPINVNASPSVLCAGNTASLTATGANSYTWQPGNLSGSTVSVSPAVSTSYTVTGTGALGCTSSAVYYYPVAALNNMTVVANQVPCTDTLTVSIPGVVAFPPNAAKYYIRDQEPWNVNNNINALNAVFGAGNYQTATFSGAVPATIFTNATQFVFLEGSDVNAVALNTFFTANQSLIESWVNNGGRLFINAAPNNGGTIMNWGFGGVTLNYNNAQSTVTAVTPLHPVFVGPFTPLATTLTGNSYSHAHITGGNTTPIITGSGLNILTQKSWGSGVVLFGGITSPNFHTPATEAQNVWQNILHYTANSAGLLTFSYLWSNNATTPYTLPATPGTYSVTVSGYGCTGTASLTVNTVKPIINPVATPNIICSGNSAVLSNVGNFTNVWTPGIFVGPSVTVSPTTTTIYTVTATNAGNCSASDTVKVTVNPPLQVTIVQQGTSCLDSLKAIVTGVGNGAPAPGARYYIRDSDPWGTNNNVTALNAVFGAGNYQTLTFSNAVPATVFTGATQFVFLEGSDGNAVALNTFFTVNQSLIESWVNNGGRLFINSAPNVGGIIMNWGFGGVVLNYNNAQSAVSAVNPLHPIFVGPYTPLVNALTGNSYSHAHITGGNTSPIISGGGFNVLTEKIWGAGLVLFGGITSPNYHQPPPQAQNVWQNIIHYTANSANGSAPVQYAWSNSATTSYIIPPVAGTYSVTVTANGCTASATFSNAVVLNLSVNTPAICLGQSATITASGANTYVWQPGGATGASITVNPSLTTTYTVTATNANGCSTTGTQTIVVNTLPSVSANANPSTLCVGASSQLSATGGTSYTWQPGNLTGSPTVLPTVTTTYTVTATNANGCTNTATKTVIVNALPIVSTSATPATVCAGASSQLSATGGTSYTWQPGNLTGTPTVTPSLTTTYTVTAINANGCTKTATQTITVNALPTVSASANPSSICIGSSSQLSATGGISYTWQPGNLTGSPTVSPSVTTTYTVTATNANGCTATATQTLLVSNTLLVSASANPATICLGASTQLSATGGTTYTWQPGNLTGAPIVSPNVTTVYTVTAVNANGCSNTATVNVAVNALPTVTASASPSSVCLGASSQLNATGGTSYTWQPGNLTGSPIVSPTITTTYTVTATNANGCTATATQTVAVNNTLLVSANANPSALCVGASSQLSATGGTTYAWQPGNLTGSPIVSPSVTTTYTVTGTNANGCSNTATITVVVNVLPSINTTATPSSICVGGSSQLSATGGTTYAWQPGNLTGSPTVSPSVTTTYTVTATNANGCTNTATKTIVVNTLPTVNASATPSSICLGGSSQLSATGGTSYTWQPGNLTGSPIVSPTITTTYTVTATNANGCTATATQTVSVSNALLITTNANLSSICVGGSSQLSATGGTSYSWQPGSLIGSPIVSPNATTTYTVTVTNANGCTNTATQTVIVNSLPNIVASASVSSVCVGVSSQLSATGGTSYSWQPGNLSGSPIVFPSTTTTYTVTGTNANGCSNTSIATIVVNASPTLQASATPSSICVGGSSQLSANGGTSYTWQPGNLTGSPIVSPTINTIYTVTATNANGCSSSATQIVVVNNPPTVSTSSNPNSICGGGNATLFAFGGVSYTWQPGNLTGTPTVSPTVNTVYTVTATDNNGCTNTSVLQVAVVPAPTVTAQANPAEICSGGGTILQGGGAVSYLWMPVNIFGSPMLFPTVNTTYTVTGTSANGCTATSLVTVNVVAPPTFIQNPTNQVSFNGGSAQFSVLSSNPNVTYQWQRDYGLGFQNLTNFNQFSGVTTPTLTVSNLTQANNGNLFRCQLSLPGCFVTSTAASLKVDYALGVNQTNVSQFIAIYPNPANTTLHIHAEQEALGSQLQLRDLSGRVCYTQTIDNENTSIPVATWARGLYMLHILSDKGNWVYRIVLSD